MKRVILLLAMLLAMPAFACSLGSLEFSPIFETGSSRLSGAEMLRLAGWRADLRSRFPKAGEFYVEVPESKAAGVTQQLAESRRVHLMNTLRNLGVDAADIKLSTVVKRSVDPFHLKSAGTKREAIRYINTASIAISPRCPHACCPGPEPIQK
ncbi:hypothetical protein BJN34_17125 [Cupriavidus necator]|uniref:OmpA-like domain-containing protein n=1 Tax=Cupriavidus necator TaxID=106590 RepID=A0A1U9UTX0_CUPNE|nr:hypothetical protein [Cupriavidus necator]AQV95605.1 hypothetical protein BJN34_17125 [Cupriavidus necator]